MAGARALLRATGMEREDFGKPIVAVANSYTQFVPATSTCSRSARSSPRRSARRAGCRASSTRSPSTTGSRWGHGGMLYSLPSRDLISDSVEYIVNAHCTDALVCISKLRQDHAGAEPGQRDRRRRRQRGLRRRHRADRGGGLSCLTEALGLALPGNGSTLATHTARRRLYEDAGTAVVRIAKRHHEQDDPSVLPRAVATRKAFGRRLRRAREASIGVSGSADQGQPIAPAAAPRCRR